MRTLTAVQIAILNSPVIEAFYTVQIEIPAGSGNFKRFSTYYTDVALSDGRIFTANTNIVKIDLPKISTSVDSSKYTIAFSDPEFSLGLYAEGGIVGAPAEVRLVLINQTTGLPETTVANTILVYKGQVDSTGYQINTSELGESTFVLVCGSPVSNLSAIKSVYASKTFMREKINVNDSCFDQVYQGSGKIRLKWGKV
jgi:hypothetical protein